jgi:hypothetical protein
VKTANSPVSASSSNENTYLVIAIAERRKVIARAVIWRRQFHRQRDRPKNLREFIAAVKTIVNRHSEAN